MGLKELDLLKTTLLNIDDVDEEVKQLAETNNILQSNLEIDKSAINQWEFEISKLEPQIHVLEEMIAINESFPSVSKLQSKLKIANNERDILIKAWVNSVQELERNNTLIDKEMNKIEAKQSNQDLPLCLLVFVLWLVVSVGLTPEGPTGSDLLRELIMVIWCFGWPFLAVAAIIWRWEAVRNRNTRKKESLRLVFDEKHAIVTNEIVPGVLTIGGTHPANIKNAHSQAMKIKTQIDEAKKAIRNLKDSKSEISNKHKKIDDSKSALISNTELLDQNAEKIKERKKERKELWTSISHLIPYSDLIN